jgi:S-adenosyl-L-methionine hydrolase (adenosine-forming)
MTIITLTTDFGTADGYVGVMKGVLLGIAPDARLVDLSHEIAAQDVRGAEYVLSRATPFFPDGTVHLAVVDPGVGSHRRPLLIATSRASYVGPDNGLFTFALGEPSAEVFELDRPEFWLASVSSTFHGRDIFAPIAAHVARGVPRHNLGHRIDDPVRLLPITPQRHGDGHITGQVIHIDRFGNLITNISGSWLWDRRWRIEVRGHQIGEFGTTYADAGYGAVLALVSSADTVEIAVRDGNAATRLGVGVGEVVTIWPVT